MDCRISQKPKFVYPLPWTHPFFCRGAGREPDTIKMDALSLSAVERCGEESQPAVQQSRGFANRRRVP